MIGRGISPDVCTFSILMDVMCKEGIVKKAHELFYLMIERGVEPNTITYSALMDGYFLHSQMDEATKVLHSMVVRGCEPDVISYTILINGYCMAKKLDDAMQIFEDMRSKGLTPNVITYTSLIDGLCKVGRVVAAQEFFMKMQARGPSPNVYTYNVLLDGLFTNGCYAEAMRQFEELENGGLEADIVTYNIVINHMCKSNNVDEAKKLFDSLPSMESQPDTRTFNIMINGLITRGMLKESEDLFTEMVEKGPTPDDITYNTMVRGSLLHNDIDKAMQLLNEMIYRGFSLNATSISIVEDLLAAHGPKSKFIDLVDKVLPKHQSKGSEFCMDLQLAWASEVVYLFAMTLITDDQLARASEGVSLLLLCCKIWNACQLVDVMIYDYLDMDLIIVFQIRKSFTRHKGVVWVLEPEKIPNKVIKEDKDIWEVFPVKKHAKIKEHSLIFADPDGSHTTISLIGCTILSVSATNLPSRKWAKRYPIKIENRDTVVYKGSRTCYIYLETSWEKESWCKAIRLASSVDKEMVNWYARLTKEFQDYLTSLNEGYPSFIKPSLGFSNEALDKSSKVVDGSSKVRLFLKKLAKKASKNGLENRGNGNLSSIHEKRKSGEKLHPFQEILSLRKSTEKTTAVPKDEDKVLQLPQSGSSRLGSRSFSTVSDADSEEKFGIDEGTLCWNLLVSRFFFDAKRNSAMKSSVHSQIQRTLANMRTPSYIGGITCTGLDLGSLPPYIHSMRVIPIDMNVVWAMELDIEYSGGAVLDFETRLEVREPEFQKGIVNTSLESSSVGEATSEILEGFEYLGDQLKLSGEVVSEAEKRDEGDHKFVLEGKNEDNNLSIESLNGPKVGLVMVLLKSKAESFSPMDILEEEDDDEEVNSLSCGTDNVKSTTAKSTSVPRWKAIINSMANQVSQVPLSLKIRVTSIRGTIRLHIKPPPSDRLWFAFTSMPEIDFNLESSVGDHKITNTHIALLLGSRFKTAIRDTIVFPNFDSVYIPWMVAEKDDWVPRKIAPFIWVRQEAGSNLEDKRDKPDNVEHDLSEDLTSSSMSEPQELMAPLLCNDESRESHNSECQPFAVREKQIPVLEDLYPKKVGRRARMMDLGKKMGEKLEEKRRNIEEKSRNIVEKMRGP
ncbi:hypothetical protein GIB67_003627 [Kingdonia uniflora]|uniref:SMP-LTD domain-containing protein n=1 Tax=Kingdonia uniflora TaxID=39325 RepID=A0A7J7MF11_9MAGN|nr:hypothetical protein GIB67_003627 [Kingdonia uniflora]